MNIFTAIGNMAYNYLGTKAKINNIVKQKNTAAIQYKNSAVGSLIAYNNLGKPVWTPRNYESLAKHGYSKNVIVYRCVNLVAKGAGSVPWRLYKGQHELIQHPLLDLLQHPAPNQAGSAFIEAIVGYLLLSGNAYIEKSYTKYNKYPKELYVLRPDRMKVIPAINGQPGGFEYSVNGRSKNIKSNHLTGESNVLHIKLFNPLNDWYGMSPIEAAACAIDQHNAVASHNLSLLQNGGRPSGALIINKSGKHNQLNAEQVNELRQDLKNIVEGEKNSGRILMLDGEFDWQEMGLSPKDLDFISGKNLSAREIAQAFNIPPILVGIKGDATFANYKEARLHLWEDTILPILDMITDSLNNWLGKEFGDSLRINYDIDGIPALASKREEAWTKINNANFLTTNEKRKAVGYAPIADGDELTCLKI